MEGWNVLYIMINDTIAKSWPDCINSENLDVVPHCDESSFKHSLIQVGERSQCVRQGPMRFQASQPCLFTSCCTSKNRNVDTGPLDLLGVCCPSVWRAGVGWKQEAVQCRCEQQHPSLTAQSAAQRTAPLCQ